MISIDYVGIGEASQILKLSRTSIQKLVDGGQLAAIKTLGGHRRIVRTSLDELSQKIGPKALLRPGRISEPGYPNQLASSNEHSVLHALIVEDDPVLATLLRGIFEEDYPDIKCTVATDGLDAVLQLERHRPRILITDLSMQPFDGFTLLNLVSNRSEYDNVAIVVMSGMSTEEIEAKGGLPRNALFFPKPVSIERLRGFLDAHVQTDKQTTANAGHVRSTLS